MIFDELFRGLENIPFSRGMSNYAACTCGVRQDVCVCVCVSVPLENITFKYTPLLCYESLFLRDRARFNLLVKTVGPSFTIVLHINSKTERDPEKRE